MAKRARKAASRSRLQRVPLWQRAVLVGVLVMVVGGAFLNPSKPELYPPKPGAPVVEVYVVDHGYHTGLVVPVDRLRQFGFQGNREGAIATSQRFIGHRWVEIGWGDEGFYRQVPTIDKITFGLVWSAVTNATRPSVLHLTGFDGDVFTHFSSSVFRLKLSEPGFAKLVAAYNETVQLSPTREPIDLGPGLVGDSAFYRANGIYNGLNDCNQWVARLLASAGVPVTSWTSSLSWVLGQELYWRAVRG